MLIREFGKSSGPLSQAPPMCAPYGLWESRFPWLEMVQPAGIIPPDGNAARPRESE